MTVLYSYIQFKEEKKNIKMKFNLYYIYVYILVYVYLNRMPRLN